MGLFSKKPASKASAISVKQLRKLRLGLSAPEVTSLIGQPNFVNPAADAMKRMFGAGQVIGGDALLARQASKEYWLYETPAGSFQMLMDAGRISAFSGLDSIIEKMKKGGKAESNR